MIDYSESRIAPQEVWIKKYENRAKIKSFGGGPIQMFAKSRKISSFFEFYYFYRQPHVYMTYLMGGGYLYMSLKKPMRSISPLND